jgi:dTDP-4-dehydrorhamnose reductase
MGTALADVLAGGDVEVIGVNSRDLDVNDFAAVRALVERVRPGIILNTVARLGINDCERNPTAACRINALFPRLLGELAAADGTVLVHFSSEAVFSGDKGDFLTEDDRPDPVNAYGYSKYLGELAVRDAGLDHYIFRLPVLFGASAKPNQLVERMVTRARGGEKHLHLADDIVSSPTYAKDAAEAIWQAVSEKRPFGLYHVANAGKASLFELMSEVFSLLHLEVVLERASYRDFPSLGRKNTMTPLRQTKLPELRSWRDALVDYCAHGMG